MNQNTNISSSSLLPIQPIKKKNTIYIVIGVIFFILLVVGLVVAALFFNWNIITVISNLLGSTSTSTKLTCPTNCSGNGTCDTSTGLCTCTGGYTGPNCAPIPCPNNCSEHGTCDKTKGVCTCTDGYTGINCAPIPCPNDCSGHGSCNDTNGRCTCNGAYSGVDCSNNYNMSCSTDAECSTGNYCNKIKGTCDYKRDVACTTNDECSTKNCIIDPVSKIGTCEYVYIDPRTTIDCKDDTTCGKDYYCNTALGAVPGIQGKCSRKLEDGSICSVNNKCISTYCNATTGKCEKMSNNSVCVNDTNCISGYCNKGTAPDIFLQEKTGTCQDRIKIGDTCTVDKQCPFACGRMKEGDDITVCCPGGVTSYNLKDYCTNVGEIGQRCPRNEFCKSKYCDNGFFGGWGTCK